MESEHEALDILFCAGSMLDVLGSYFVE